MTAPKIALIHATPLAMMPIQEALERLWPDARCMNLLDDSLSSDLATAGSINTELMDRFESLTRYAEAVGAHAVLFTCSAFGSAVEAAAAKAGVPTFKPNEAMFGEALDVCAKLGRVGRIGMLSTFSPSVASMRDELLHMASVRGVDVTLRVECPDGAFKALSEGRVDVHDTLVSEAGQKLLDQDVIMLGQFSISHMRGRIALETSLPVLSSPDSAVRLLKMSVEHRAAAFPQPHN